MLSISYIGSKSTRFTMLDNVFAKYIKRSTIFADLFSGTGIVGWNVAQKYGCQVVSNDLQYYSYVLNRANMSIYSEEEINLINQKVEEYNELEAIADFVSDNYSPPERMYFTTENAQRIDTIRLTLEEDLPSLPENVYYYLLASLISAADKVANTSCIYGAYLKAFKRSALKTLTLFPFEGPNVPQEGLCFNNDIMNVLDQEYDVVYLDPPYNHRQYSGNYHVLETIALNDSPSITGKTGMRDCSNQRSDFCSRVKVKQAFNDLITNLKAKVIILSYNDEGLLTHEDIQEILEEKGDVTVHNQAYKKFKAKQGIERDQVFEYIFVCEVV